jgi:hypothetical protein
MPHLAALAKRVEIPAKLGELILLFAETIAHRTAQAYRIARSPRKGGTLRPGKDTPLWNELRAQLRPQLRKRGAQAYLGRLLGLPRQRVHAYLTNGSQMPDAERTLQLIAWLVAAQTGQRPA